MAPRVVAHPGTRPTESEEPTVDTKSLAQARASENHGELLAAACAAMRLLQSRQMHTPPKMVDPREERVLRQLRSAVRWAS
jgi:hypothetical protein